MKRRSHYTKDQSSLKKIAVSSSSDTLQAKITTKLQTLVDGLVSELHNISADKRPDVTSLFNNQNLLSNFIDATSYTKTASSNSDNSFDASTLVLQNFINSAKSRISGQLSKGENQRKKLSGNNLLETTNKPCPPVKFKTIIADPLQIQISLKLQSVLIKALDNKRLSTNDKIRNASSPENIISDSELQNLSSMLQDFMSSAKKKLSHSLSTTHIKSECSLSGQKSSAKSSSNRSQLCDIPQATTNSHKQTHIVELHTKCDSKIIPGQYKCNKQGKENLHCSVRPTHIQKMNSPSASDSDSFHSSSPDIPSTSMTDYDMHQNGSDDGILLIGEAERAPEYLDLEIHTDVDDPSYEQPESDSEEEVIVLGEKRPTYQEITLDEDDDGQVFEKVEEKALEKNTENENEIEELLFNCPKCEKVFRVESLLKFHIRMHGQVDSSSHLVSASECSSQIQDSDSEDEINSRKSPNTNQSFSSIRKEKENKIKSKTKSSSHKSKFRHEKRDKNEKKKYMSKYS